ncbi:MAG: ATP-binding protein [Cyanobacteria bacterium P01_C01_bin.89]
MFAPQPEPSESSKVTRLSSQSQTDLDQLRRDNEHLETENRQLQEELNALRKQQLEQIQRSKLANTGSLAAGLAHEINNPICFIHGNLIHAQQYASLLLEIVEAYGDRLPVPDPALAAMLDEVDIEFIREDFPRLMASMREGSKRIRGVVSSLRTFANLDAAHLKKVDLHRNLDSALRLLNHRLLDLGQCSSSMEINVVRHYRELPPVECYPGLINQVFSNVVNNAIDAIYRRFGLLDGESQESLEHGPLDIQSFEKSPKEAAMAALSGGQLELETRWNQEENWVEVTVRDDGDGIAEDNRDRIFDPFFTTKPVGQGIGLGLTETRQVIVEHHRGQIELDTTPARGTALTLKIPVNYRPDFVA